MIHLPLSIAYGLIGVFDRVMNGTTAGVACIRLGKPNAKGGQRW